MWNQITPVCSQTTDSFHTENLILPVVITTVRNVTKWNPSRTSRYNCRFFLSHKAKFPFFSYILAATINTECGPSYWVYLRNDPSKFQFLCFSGLSSVIILNQKEVLWKPFTANRPTILIFPIPSAEVTYVGSAYNLLLILRNQVTRSQDIDKQSLHMDFCICCALIFLNQFDFYFPLFQIMVMNLTERKIKLNWLKNLEPFSIMTGWICLLSSCFSSPAVPDPLLQTHSLSRKWKMRQTQPRSKSVPVHKYHGLWSSLWNLF